MQTLKMKSQELIDEAARDLEETRNCLHQETEGQRGKIMEVDRCIEETSRQLQGLKHYKDKEYPVRQVRIEQLKETQDERHGNQIADREELEIQILEEREHYDHHIRAMRAQLQARATEVKLGCPICVDDFALFISCPPPKIRDPRDPQSLVATIKPTYKQRISAKSHPRLQFTLSL